MVSIVLNFLIGLNITGSGDSRGKNDSINVNLGFTVFPNNSAVINKPPNNVYNYHLQQATTERGKATRTKAGFMYATTASRNNVVITPKANQKAYQKTNKKKDEKTPNNFRQYGSMPAPDNNGGMYAYNMNGAQSGIMATNNMDYGYGVYSNQMQQSAPYGNYLAPPPPNAVPAVSFVPQSPPQYANNPLPQPPPSLQFGGDSMAPQMNAPFDNSMASPQFIGNPMMAPPPGQYDNQPSFNPYSNQFTPPPPSSQYGMPGMQPPQAPQSPNDYGNMWANPACQYQGIANHPNWRFLPRNCGVGRMKNRIIGGDEALPGEFPWVIKMTFAMKSSIPWNLIDIPILCSGGLISAYYVLTADHCTRNEEGVFVKSVILGKDMLEDNPCPNNQCDGFTQIHLVERVIQYSATTIMNQTVQHDIALLKLRTAVVFNEYIQPACIPKGDLLDNPGKYIKPGEHITVSGFGAVNGTDHMQTSMNHLMFVHLSIQPLERCQPQFKEFKRIDTTLICAGDPPVKDTCAGDSGSPVVIPLSVKGPPRNYMVGLVSFGLADCGVNYAIYVNIACYVKWILDHVLM